MGWPQERQVDQCPRTCLRDTMGMPPSEPLDREDWQLRGAGAGSHAASGSTAGTEISGHRCMVPVAGLRQQGCTKSKEGHNCSWVCSQDHNW